MQVEARLPAHAGGVVALDMRGDMVITAGLGLRHGQPVVERAVRIFDLRVTPRLLASVRSTATSAMVDSTAAHVEGLNIKICPSWPENVL